MDKREDAKPDDLEERTAAFAEAVRALVRRLPHTLANREDARQLIRASGSVGANYIEANEALSRRDFKLRLKIARREAKESRYLLRPLDTGQDQALDRTRCSLVAEATELLRVLSAIITNNS